MTGRQEELWQYLLTVSNNPVQPSVEEMSLAIGSTKSNCQRMLQALHREGKIVKRDLPERFWRAIPLNPFADIPSQKLADELRNRGYRVEASKVLDEMMPGWAISKVDRL